MNKKRDITDVFQFTSNPNIAFTSLQRSAVYVKFKNGKTKTFVIDESCKIVSASGTEILDELIDCRYKYRAQVYGTLILNLQKCHLITKPKVRLVSKARYRVSNKT